MHTYVLIFFALGLLLLFGFFLHGGGYVRQTWPGRFANPSEDNHALRYPRAAVIVPITGHSPAMRPSLESLLHQDYFDCELILVTQDLLDPATPFVRDFMRGKENLRHVVSGYATRCCQKNYNLLAGLAALPPDVEILVFCDSTHLAPPHFLKSLIQPLMTGQAVMTTSYHHIIPQDGRPATLGMHLSALVIHLFHGIPRLAQPWGGATAITRRVFEEYRVGQVWADTVVDDVSLALHLGRAGIRVKSVPAATLATPLAGQSFGGWVDWLTRQIIYLKFFVPGQWLAASSGVFFLTGPPLLALSTILAGLLGLGSWPLALAGMIYLLLLGGIALCYRTLSPENIPWHTWIPVFFLTLLVIGLSCLRTWTTNTIAWRQVAYRVGWGGRVKEVVRPVEGGG